MAGQTAAVSEHVGKGLFEAIETHKKGNTLMDLFWEEQKKAFSTDPKGA